MKLYEVDEGGNYTETTLQAGDALENDIEEEVIMVVREKEAGKLITLCFSPNYQDIKKPFSRMMASEFRRTCNWLVSHLGLECRGNPTPWYSDDRGKIRGYTCRLEGMQIPSQ